ncbi:hypothetical protein RJ639_037194 [Escallonia herrerae]|uniref:DPH-type MB domain-containing protein n=1 Tax=Escallonia herrerae TaxID=1293975 RepID=A0AA88WNS2_9ASTE|nr:hypothetical protein RJ639_037194 [Escallonia herrerae]
MGLKEINLPLSIVKLDQMSHPTMENQIEHVSIVKQQSGTRNALSNRRKPLHRDSLYARAWELLGNIQSCGVYDTKLRALRQDAIGAEDVTFEDLTVEDTGDVVEFLYQCQCSDYYSIDSQKLGEMGFVLLRSMSTISLQSQNALPASVVLPCVSCSLKVRLFFNAANTTLQRDHHL